MNQIAFIGAGNMASALIQGMLNAGTDPATVRAADIAEAQLEQLAGLGVKTSTSNATVVSGADIIVLAVKPQVLVDILQPLTLAADQLVVSIAAGIDMQTLQAATSTQQPIVRCMPNTPALVGAGMAALFANSQVNSVQRTAAAGVLEAVGRALWVPEEAMLDAVTAVSGSGPAYFFYLMEAMIDAGVNLGLPEETATELTLQTALGAAQLAQSSEDTPGQLRRNVTSPGGTTERALDLMNEANVADAIVRALKGAAERSAELAEEFGR